MLGPEHPTIEVVLNRQHRKSLSGWGDPRFWIWVAVGRRIRCGAQKIVALLGLAPHLVAGNPTSKTGIETMTQILNHNGHRMTTKMYLNGHVGMKRCHIY